MGNKTDPKFFQGEEKVEYTRSYTQLGVTFTWLRFSLQEVACARLSCGYVALGALKRQCAHLSFQEQRTKLWLFDTLVTPTLLYGVETWQPTLNKENYWKDLERPLESMIVRMIRSKASVPHDIIRAKMGTASIITEALFQSMACIQSLWEIPKSSQGWQLCHQDNWLNIHCWYVEMQQWFESHSISINALTPFQYSLDCPHLNMTKLEKNKVMFRYY